MKKKSLKEESKVDFLSPNLTFLFAIKVEYDNLIQTINQLNEKIQILQSDFQILQSESNKTIAAKDAAITSLEQAMNERSNVTTELSVVIFIPSSDEIYHHGSKVIKIT